MIVYQGVIEDATGDLLRCGYIDFTADGMFDEDTESVRTDVPFPGKIRGDIREAQMHRWGGASWSLVAQSFIGTDGIVRFYSGNTLKNHIGWNESATALIISGALFEGSEDLLSFLATEIVVNDSAQDIDTRIEGSSVAQLVVVDAGNDTVTIGGNAAIGIFNVIGDTSLAGALLSAPDEITATSAGVAASLTTINTEVTTNGDADLDDVTLANGISGQIKHIYCVVSGGGSDSWKITPANMVGGTQITFGTGVAGQGCTLVYADNEGWVVTANNGGTIA